MRNSHARAPRAISCSAPARGSAGPPRPHTSPGRAAGCRPGQRTLLLLPTVTVPLAAQGSPQCPGLSTELSVLPRRTPVWRREGSRWPWKGLSWRRTWNPSLDWRLAHRQRGLAGAHVPSTLVAPVPQPDKGSKEQG